MNVQMISAAVRSKVPSTAVIKTENTTSAVPSLSNDSPSMKVERSARTPKSLKRATTATGSVALRITPSKYPEESPQPLPSQWPKFCALYGISMLNNHPRVKVDTSNPGPARYRQVYFTLLKTCQSMAKADSKIKAGRKICSIRWGSILMRVAKLCPRASFQPSRTAVPIIAPNKRRITVYGTGTFLKSILQREPTPKTTNGASMDATA
mmetsp:Transcript_25390/g.32794  ORF Transcript_25390/g.32794 Transcript_25390/m.32794 type:complete len:209 (+) Transcript_25390:305-931(+)